MGKNIKKAQNKNIKFIFRTQNCDIICKKIKEYEEKWKVLKNF